MIICNLKMLLSKPDAYLPKEDVTGYTLMAGIKDEPNMETYVQIMQLFDWIDIGSDKDIKKYVPISDQDGKYGELQGLYYRSDLPVWMLSTLNTVTEVMSAIDLSKLTDDVSKIELGSAVFMSGMYNTVIDQLINTHKNDKFKFKKITNSVQGLINITLPMTVTEVTEDTVTLNIVPYLLPLMPVADMTLSKVQMETLRPYFKILEEE